MELNMNIVKNLLITIVAGIFFSACSAVNQPAPMQEIITPPKKPHVIKKKKRLHYTMLPYKRKGILYQPKFVSKNTKMVGLASWYGPGFQGLPTSSGKVYNMYAYTIAHKTWPMGTVVKVENLKTHKSVYAKVIDRGPFVKGRIVDCSYAVARKIGLLKDGVAPVRLTVVHTSSNNKNL